MPNLKIVVLFDWIANGIFVAAPNRIGLELPPKVDGHTGAGIEFWGQSFLCDPAGRVMQRGSVDHEEIVQADCDLSLINTQRTHWPFLRDRRIDAYGGIVQRYLD